MKVLGNAVVFVLLYVLLMIPTYVLPYFGSNSYVVNGIAAAVTGQFTPLFSLHLLTLLLLVGIAWARGRLIQRGALIIFPILALIFDLAPMLNAIPLVPTIMHLLTLVLGIMWESRKAAVTAPAT